MEISNLILHEQLPPKCVYLAKNKYLKKKLSKYMTSCFDSL